MNETARTGKALAAYLVAIAVAWPTYLLCCTTPVLTAFRGQPPVAPLYAFVQPVLRPGAMVFPVIALLVWWGARWLLDPSRLSRNGFGAALIMAGLLLPFALFLVRQSPGELGQQFGIYRNEEFFDDAARIVNAGAFLRDYVTTMPELSLHGRHFPPGHALFLYAVRRIAGPGYLPAGIAVLVTFAVGLFICYRAFAQCVDEVRARQAALLLLAAPALLDFACTSMDAVFFLWAALALWLSLRTFSDQGNLPLAVLTGLAFFLATGTSFSALPLGLVVTFYALIIMRQRGFPVLRRLLVIGLAFIVSAMAVHAVSGFSLLACFLVAHAENFAFMSEVIGRRPSALYGPIAAGNLLAWLIGAGAGLVAAVGLRLERETLRRDAWPLAAALTLATMVLGGIYILETERIWLFALPWLALIAVGLKSFSHREISLLLAAGWIQAWAMEVLFFTLW